MFHIILFVSVFSNDIKIQWMNGSIATPMNIYYPIVFSSYVGLSACIGNGTINITNIVLNGFTMANYGATSWSYYSAIAVGY